MLAANLEFLTAPVPTWLGALFVACTVLAAGQLGRAVGRASGPVRHYWGLTGGWLAVQAGLAMAGFYQTNLYVLPPRLALGALLPALVILLTILLTTRGRCWMARLPLADLTAISVVRVGVELGLYYLAVGRLVPEIMTFEGRNFDVLAGLTAPGVALLWRRRQLSRGWLLVWHGIALMLLLNIVVLAIASAPSPIQRLAFEQPNVVILRFPFVWLPAFIVPVVLFSHVASLYQLLRRPALAGLTGA